ncbi:MAG: helix-turn-helix domain-containing protein, partial [Patescibacteria group bacterium]
MLIKELQKIGLSDKEAKVYLAVLGLGKASVQTIAAKAGVNRATTYSVLGTLKEKGLCSTFQKVKKTFYVVSSPDYLKEIFEIKKVEIEEKQ